VPSVTHKPDRLIWQKAAPETIDHHSLGAAGGPGGDGGAGGCGGSSGDGGGGQGAGGVEGGHATIVSVAQMTQPDLIAAQSLYQVSVSPAFMGTFDGHFVPS
jgi:hypothetical protein